MRKTKTERLIAHYEKQKRGARKRTLIRTFEQDGKTYEEYQVSRWPYPYRETVEVR